VTKGFHLFQPSNTKFLQNLTNYSGREGCCFLVLDKLDGGTLEDKLSHGTTTKPEQRPSSSDSDGSTSSSSAASSSVASTTSRLLVKSLSLTRSKSKTKLPVESTLGGEWRVEADKIHGLFSRVFHDVRGHKRKALQLKCIIASIQIAEALAYLHSHNIIYRDLKPENIGFTHDNTIKLFDFGLVKELKAHRKYADGTYLLSYNTGSRRYMAPEVAKRERYNLSADVYSFAMVLWEICTMEKPYERYTEEQHLNLALGTGKRPSLELVEHLHWPKCMQTLLQQCWCQNLHDRIDFPTVLQKLNDIYTVVSKGSHYKSLVTE